MRVVSSMTLETGCIEPRPRHVPGRLKSNASAADAPAAVSACLARMASPTASRRALSSLPIAGRSAGEVFFISCISAGTSPFRPRYLMRSASASSAVFAAAMSARAAVFASITSGTVISG